jgi:hypothetical protein
VKPYFVRPCDEPDEIVESKGQGARRRTWDVVAREDGRTVDNLDTREAARNEADRRNREADEIEQLGKEERTK